MPRSNARSRNAWRALCVAGLFSWSLAALASSFVHRAPMAAPAWRSQRSLRRAVPELLTLAESAEDEALDTEVDANFKSISPQDMAALQLQLAQTEGDARKPLQRLLGSIQKAMESRMAAVTKDIEALMQSSGNIEENIRECLQKQESVLPMIAVLQMNIARARKAENEQLERALTFLYTTINEELESKVPMVNRVLSRCLSTEDAEPRRELLKAYFAEESEEDKPKLMADALLGLVKEAQEQKGQKGFDLKGALMRIRDVALDVGVAQGEVCDEEVSEKFLEAMGPLTDACAGEFKPEICILARVFGAEIIHNHQEVTRHHQK